MTEVPEDQAFKWVVERIYSYSRWNSNPFELSADLGYGTIAGHYRWRVNSIIHHLQDEAKVLRIIEEPKVSEKLPRPLKSLDELWKAPINPDAVQHYSLELLPGFDVFARRVIGHSVTDDGAKVSVEIVGNGIAINVNEQQYKFHVLKMESAPFKIIQYLMRYPDVTLNWKNLKFEADVINYQTPPPEFIRQLGFTGDLRNMFFPVRTKTDIQFKQTLTLDAADASKLVKILTEATPD